MALKTAIKESNSKYTIKPDGRLDSVTAGDFEKAIQKVAKSKKSVLFDFEKLDYISSAGLRAILVTKKAVEAAGGKVIIAKMQAPVAKVFEMANILMHTEIFDSVESADIFLDAIQRREKFQNCDPTE